MRCKRLFELWLCIPVSMEGASCRKILFAARHRLAASWRLRYTARTSTRRDTYDHRLVCGVDKKLTELLDRLQGLDSPSEALPCGRLKILKNQFRLHASERIDWRSHYKITHLMLSLMPPLLPSTRLAVEAQTVSGYKEGGRCNCHHATGHAMCTMQEITHGLQLGPDRLHTDQPS